MTDLTPLKAILLLILSAFLSSLPSIASADADKTRLIIIVGAPGEDQFEEQFSAWAERWRTAGERGNASVETIGLEAKKDTSDRDRLQSLLKEEKQKTAADLWLVFIGHGTYDKTSSKFNLVGPDISASDLASWLKPFERPLAIINTASSSAPFINALSNPNRVIVTATKSGHEHNYARFGEHLANAITDLDADLDKDGQTSLLEAYLTASRAVQEWYDLESRLATEHALIDDNADGFGTPATWFRGIRAIKKAKKGAGTDGLRAHQLHLVRSEAEERMSPELRARRDKLELKIYGLRDRKEDLSEEFYYSQLEEFLLEMARIYEENDK